MKELFFKIENEDTLNIYEAGSNWAKYVISFNKYVFANTNYNFSKFENLQGEDNCFIYEAESDTVYEADFTYMTGVMLITYYVDDMLIKRKFQIEQIIDGVGKEAQ